MYRWSIKIGKLQQVNRLQIVVLLVYFKLSIQDPNYVKTYYLHNTVQNAVINARILFQQNHNENTIMVIMIGTGSRVACNLYTKFVSCKKISATLTAFLELTSFSNITYIKIMFISKSSLTKTNQTYFDATLVKKFWTQQLTWLWKQSLCSKINFNTSICLSTSSRVCSFGYSEKCIFFTLNAFHGDKIIQVLLQLLNHSASLWGFL